MNALNGPTPTATLDELKKAARRIKKSDHVPHHHALELAAARAGFESWHQATLSLAPPAAQGSRPEIDDSASAIIARAEAQHQAAKDAWSPEAEQATVLASKDVSWVSALDLEAFQTTVIAHLRDVVPKEQYKWLRSLCGSWDRTEEVRPNKSVSREDLVRQATRTWTLAPLATELAIMRKEGGILLDIGTVAGQSIWYDVWNGVYMWSPDPTRPKSLELNVTYPATPPEYSDDSETHIRDVSLDVYWPFKVALERAITEHACSKISREEWATYRELAVVRALKHQTDLARGGRHVKVSPEAIVRMTPSAVVKRGYSIRMGSPMWESWKRSASEELASVDGSAIYFFRASGEYVWQRLADGAAQLIWNMA